MTDLTEKTLACKAAEEACQTIRPECLRMKAVVMTLAAVIGLSALGIEYELKGNWRSLPDDPRCDMRPGLKMSCRVKFEAHPSEKGQMTLLQKGRPTAPGSFWLRGAAFCWLPKGRSVYRVSATAPGACRPFTI